MAAPAGAHFRARRDARYLTAFNGWLRANGNKVLIAALIVGGAIMAGNGIFGLAGG